MKAPGSPTAPPAVNRVTRHLRRTFVAGLLALIPLVATILILRIVFDWVDGQAQPVVKEIFGKEITGVGIGLTVVVIYLMGLVVANILGRWLVKQFEGLILRIPIARWIYNLFKQTVDALKMAGQTSFRVVMVPWPSKDIYTIGFQTGTVTGKDGKIYYNVLIPTTPTPQTGLLAIVPEEDVILTDMTVDEGLRMVVSSGVITPADMMQRMRSAKGSSAVAPVEHTQG